MLILPYLLRHLGRDALIFLRVFLVASGDILQFGDLGIDRDTCSLIRLHEVATEVREEKRLRGVNMGLADSVGRW
jgi:hypothetical protein